MAFLLLNTLFTAATALKLSVPEFRVPTATLETANALITAAPSPHAVELRLAKRAVPTTPSCAYSCIASAVTKSTNCQLGDHVCECATTNIYMIYFGAYNCVLQACGSASAVAIGEAGSSVCSEVYAGKYTAPSQAVTQTAVVLTQTATDGTAITTTAIVNVPVSAPSSSSSSGSSLSTGALAGIVVGSVVGGALLVCAMILVYKCGRRKSKTEPPEAPGAAPPTIVPPTVPPAKAVTVPGGDHKPELPATAVALGTSPRPMTQSNISEVSRNPSVLSVPTPMTPQSAMVTPPPTYPGMAIPPAWQQYPQQPVHEVADRNVMARADVQEVQGGWPEMASEGPRPQELHGQHYNGNVYEMSSGNMR